MKTRLRNIFGPCIAGLIICVMSWGCAGVGQKLDDWQAAMRKKLGISSSEADLTGNIDGDEEYFIHTSQRPGETLAEVAEWYTGNSVNSEKLADHNPYVNPDRIVVGSEIIIPVSLLVTREPLLQRKSTKQLSNTYKHTVRWPGESLSLIAAWYTGSPKNWRQLAKANPRLNPNRIIGGNVILIPSALLKTPVPLPQKEAARYTSNYFAYKVKEDDEKLSDIAERYTGNSANYSLLAKANPDLNPDHLVIGNEVYIPPNLLKIRQPFKAKKPAVSLAKPAVAAPAPKSKTTLAEDDNIKLFGPKQHPNN